MAAVLVHVELEKRRPHASSLAALATGRRLASAWGATLYAAVIVHDPTLAPAAAVSGTTSGNDATNPALAITGVGARVERKGDDLTSAERVVRAGTAKARRAPDDVPTPVRPRRDTKLPAEPPRRRGAIVIGGSARRGARVDEAGDTGRHETLAPADVHDREPTASAVLAAAELADLDRELAHAGADKVVVARTDGEVQPLWSAIGAAWSGVVDQLRPRLVLFGGDAPATAELGARTGARIGARLLVGARASGVAEVELRDAGGAYVRAHDSGATVALIAGAIAPATDVTAPSAEVDLVLLTVPGNGGDRARALLAGRAPAPLAHAATAIVALGDDALAPAIVAAANRLAELVGGIVVGGPAAAAAGAIPHAAVFERDTAIAPELCIAVGSVALDLAGTTTLVAIGPGAPAKIADGTLAGPAAEALAELVRALEEPR